MPFWNEEEQQFYYFFLMAPSPTGTKDDEWPSVAEVYYAVTRDMTHFSLPPESSDDSVAREAQVVRAFRRGGVGEVDQNLGTGSCFRTGTKAATRFSTPASTGTRWIARMCSRQLPRTAKPGQRPHGA
jgi:hypothetical protein